MNERVFILLPVHNRREITRKFINCLKTQTYRNFHLVLIDDGSTDGTERMVRENISPEQLTVIRGKGNWWWAGSLQRGVDWLKKCRTNPLDIILIINDDVSFSNDFIEKGAGELRNTFNTLLLAKAFDPPTKKIIETGVHANLQKMVFRLAGSSDQINCLSTRGLFLFYKDLAGIGGFHPFLLPHYGSDYEFTIRACKKNYNLKTTEKAFLIMDNMQTGWHNINGMRLSSFQAYVKIYFSKKSVPNPIYRSVFILLACPKRYVFLNLMRPWIDALRFLVKQLRKDFRNRWACSGIKRKIRNNSNDIKIIIGSAEIGQKDWICTDYPALDVVDEKSFARFFNGKRGSAFLAEHVWEHLSAAEAVLGVKNCFQFLKPGGHLRIAVPDGNHPDPNYIEQVRPGGSGIGAEDHKVLYDYKLLAEMMSNAGFHVKLLEWFDENGDFHYDEWSPEDGMVRRSMRFDQRNKNTPLTYTSLIIDGYKPL